MNYYYCIHNSQTLRATFKEITTIIKSFISIQDENITIELKLKEFNEKVDKQKCEMTDELST
jgi:hypothetical protein